MNASEIAVISHLEVNRKEIERLKKYIDERAKRILRVNSAPKHEDSEAWIESYHNDISLYKEQIELHMKEIDKFRKLLPAPLLKEYDEDCIINILKS